MRHLLMLSLLLVGCPALPNPVNPVVPLPTAADCLAAQPNLETVCPKKAKTPAGKPFSTLCTESISKSPPINLNPKCVATAKSCEEFDACTQN